MLGAFYSAAPRERNQRFLSLGTLSSLSHRGRWLVDGPRNSVRQPGRLSVWLRLLAGGTPSDRLSLPALPSTALALTASLSLILDDGDVVFIGWWSLFQFLQASLHVLGGHDSGVLCQDPGDYFAFLRRDLPSLMAARMLTITNV